MPLELPGLVWVGATSAGNVDIAMGAREKVKDG